MSDQIPAPIDPNVAAGVGTLRSVLVGLGFLLAGHGVIGPNNSITPENWQFGVGLVVIFAPIIWGAWEKFAVAKNAKDRETIAVNATLSLVSIGAAKALDGSLVSAPSMPLLPATAASAQQIIAHLGSMTPPDIVLGRPSPAGTTADDLSAAELARVKA